MSSVLPPSTAGHAISLAALGCSANAEQQQQLSHSSVLAAPRSQSASHASQQPSGTRNGAGPSVVIVEGTSPVPPAPHRLPAPPPSPPVGMVAAALTETAPTEVKPKHRVAEVREQQGVSQRTLARRLGMDVKTLQALEHPHSDLHLSQLQAFQAALDVPLIDLLEECPALSRPIAERAKMVKAMKTAVALREVKLNRRVERMAEMLCEQLVEVMPELAEVSGWPQFGSRRGTSALGRALSQPIDTSNLGLPD